MTLHDLIFIFIGYPKFQRKDYFSRTNRGFMLFCTKQEKASAQDINVKTDYASILIISNNLRVGGSFIE